MTSPMMPYQGTVDDPYEPISTGPNFDQDIGGANSVPPPPGPGHEEARVAQYAMQPTSNGPVGTLRHLAAGVMSIPREFNFHSRSLVFGIAGAAILLATSKRSSGGKVLAKGAAGGFLACLLMKRVNVGMGCTAAGLAGGYVVARMWR